MSKKTIYTVNGVEYEQISFGGLKSVEKTSVKRGEVRAIGGYLFYVSDMFDYNTGLFSNKLHHQIVYWRLAKTSDEFDKKVDKALSFDL